ncbi:MAG TPA: hypothetical protein VFR18_21225 [Terriglobia bacterium]|nr:hypothetical protein [Terriglobia bacterium]
MESQAEGKARIAEENDPELSSAIARIVESARRQLEEEFRNRLQSAVQDAEQASLKEIDTLRDQALADARIQVSGELREQFAQTFQQDTARLQAALEERIDASMKEWEAEKARLKEQLDVWRSFADAQRQMGESRTQAEILGQFLDRAEAFAPNLAIYVAKPDGLALWKTKGRVAFPRIVSKETIDPDAYFKTIVVRDKIVAAVCARPPLQPDLLDFLAGVLSRAIEIFGMRLQTRTPTAKP